MFERIRTLVQNTGGSLFLSLLNWLRRHRRGFVPAAALVIALGIGFQSAYVVRAYDVPLFNFADQIGKSVAGIWRSQPEPQAEADGETQYYQSTFVSLVGERVKLPEPKPIKRGGSLTSWGELLLALDQDGFIFYVANDRSVETSKIETPDNGYDDYRSLVRQSPYDTYTHNRRLLRFNDIAAFEAGDQRGLLVAYTKLYADRACYVSAISRLFVDEIKPETRAAGADWELIFESEPCLPLKTTELALEGHMAGGRMAFDGDRTVYFTIGDYHWDGVYGPASVPGTSLPTAQDPASDYGRVVAVDVLSGDARHISRGQRNMQGIALDARGALWTVEHGMRGGDELNLIVEGQNYGWPYESYGTLYTGQPVPSTVSFGRHDTFTKPAAAWLPSIAVSGLTLVDGFHEAWDGDLLASTLAGLKLVRIRTSDDRAVFTEFIDIGERIRQVHQHTSGEIVLYTTRASLIFISPRPGGLGAEFVERAIDELDMNATRKAALRTTIGSCMQCHSLNTGEHQNAPSLAKIHGSKIGTTGFERYSEAMRSAEGVWTNEMLVAYLKAPQAVMPGTLMPAAGTDNDEVLDAVADLLFELKNRVE